ncbi:MAG: hypothetical protein DDG59_11215 [Anaerolineae bacterium]|jgi:predicted DNA-binding protein|nr:MAG: hypothetical protein DDG59_11215 [Anaerolineae bacterium]
MERTLKIELPENVYDVLKRLAEKSGKTPEQFAQDWLNQALQETSADPLEQFIGAFRTDIEDWAAQHDRYLGKSILEHLREREE